MNWQNLWNNNANEQNPEQQVQRANPYQFEQAANHIIAKLNISTNDEVLDVCCGNGVITKLIANHCKNITGIDFSENLLKKAKQNFLTEKSCFFQGDATQLSNLVNTKYDKIYLEFSFQYFTEKGDGEKVISEMLKVLKPKGKIFIGNIPEKKRKWNHYNTFLKKFFHLQAMLRIRVRLGKFWSKSDLDLICLKLNVKGKYLKQEDKLPYSHYRFDYLIEN